MREENKADAQHISVEVIDKERDLKFIKWASVFDCLANISNKSQFSTALKN